MRASAGSRVLMIVENQAYPRDVRVRREALALTEAGYAVTVIAPASDGQPWRETVNGVRVLRYRMPPGGSGMLSYLWEYGFATTASFILSLYALVRGGFDVVHVHNPPDTLFIIGAFYKLFGKKFVFDHHDLSPEMYYARFGGKGNRFVYRTLSWLERLTCRLADHVIATNESYREVELRRGRVPADRITIVRNGPEVGPRTRLAPDPKLRARADTIIGYIGVMGYQDGLDYLLRALKHLVYDLGRTDFYAVLIGTGDAWDELNTLKSKLGLDEYVWMTGFISDADVQRYLSTADICVDPDPSNPFTDRSTMIKMMEYMALEKPIVAFDLPENHFTAQNAGLFVPANDELEFARALATLMDDPERRAKMAAYGRRRVEVDLAWKHSVPKLLGVYQSILPRRTLEVAQQAPGD